MSYVVDANIASCPTCIFHLIAISFKEWGQDSYEFFFCLEC